MERKEVESLVIYFQIKHVKNTTTKFTFSKTANNLEATIFFSVQIPNLHTLYKLRPD